MEIFIAFIFRVLGILHIPIGLFEAKLYFKTFANLTSNIRVAAY